MCLIFITSITKLNIPSHNIKLNVAGANCVVHEDNDKVDEAMKHLAMASSVSLQDLVVGNKAVCGLHLGTLLGSSSEVVAQAVQYIFHLCQEGTIKPRIHAVFPFNQVSIFNYIIHI